MKINLILLIVLLGYFSCFHVQQVDGYNCTLKSWYQDLNNEYLSLQCAKTKIEKSVQVLNSTLPSSSVLGTRIKQLKKIQDAMDNLNVEMQLISDKCSKYNGENCDEPSVFMTVISGQSLYISFDQSSVLDEQTNSLFTNNGVTFSSTSGKSSNGKYAVFDGTSSSAVSNSLINFGDGNSMSLWIRKDSSDSSIVWSFDMVNGRPGYIEFSSDFFQVYNTGNSAILTSPKIFNTPTWHHVVLVCRLDGVDLYINGALHQSTTTKFGSITQKLFIGAHFNLGWKFKGAVDDIRIFNKVLNAVEVQAIYQSK